MPQSTDRFGQRQNRSFYVLAILALFLLSIDIYPHTAEVNPSNPPAQKKGYTIGVNVDLVLMYASVFDEDGRFVRGLKGDHFKLYEDDIEPFLEFSKKFDFQAYVAVRWKYRKKDPWTFAKINEIKRLKIKRG